MRVVAQGPVREGGGTLFVCAEAPPFGGLQWTLTGQGTLTPLSDFADGAGIGSARYDAGDAVAGDTIIVEVAAYA